MKEYQKVLIALAQNGKPNAKQNKFAKLGIECHDLYLQVLCKQVANMYGHYVEPRWSRNVPAEFRGVIPSDYTEWLTMQNKVNEELKNYVENRLAEYKPAWQVMAEKHGWRPPN